MFQRALQNVGKNLHVAMTVPGKTTSFLHDVFVDYTQTAESHVRRIVVITKRKGVIGIEPAEIEVTALLGFANLDHASLSHYLKIDPLCSCTRFFSHLVVESREKNILA